MIKFTRCLGSCTIKHQDIRFKTRRKKAMETMTQNNGGIRNKPDKINPEDLPDYI